MRWQQWIVILHQSLMVLIIECTVMGSGKWMDDKCLCQCLSTLAGVLRWAFDWPLVHYSWRCGPWTGVTKFFNMCLIGSMVAGGERGMYEKYPQQCMRTPAGILRTPFDWS